MKAPVLLDHLCTQLREAQLDHWIVPVTALYHTTYREAYAAGKNDCEERWADHFEDITDENSQGE